MGEVVNLIKMKEATSGKANRILDLKLAEGEFSQFCERDNFDLVKPEIINKFKLAVDVNSFNNNLQGRLDTLIGKVCEIADKYDLGFECEGPVPGFGGKKVLLYVRYTD